MATHIRVLLLEDSEDDAALVIRELTLYGFAPESKRVDTEAGFLAELGNPYDVIISDFYLPQYDGLRALGAVRAAGLDIPVIMVSGSLGDEMAASLIKSGAADFLLKDRLARFGSAVAHALQEQRLRQDKARGEATERLLKKALETNNAELRLRVLELEALNRLFQKHIDERFTVVEAYRRLVQELAAQPYDYMTIIRRAQELPLPDLYAVVNPGYKPH